MGGRSSRLLYQGFYEPQSYKVIGNFIGLIYAGSYTKFDHFLGPISAPLPPPTTPPKKYGECPDRNLMLQPQCSK
jgi:hypothetical protein